MVHSFYWNTQITQERQEEINDWIDSLNDDDTKKLDELIRDVNDGADGTEWDNE